MPKIDPKVDAYIANAAPFAQPILKHVQSVVMKADPRLQQSIKWSHIAFSYGGLVCLVSAFKEHCGLGFWRGREFLKDDPMVKNAEDSAGSFGKIRSVRDLPPDATLARYVKIAVALNENAVPRPPRPTRAPKPVVVPKALEAALKKNAKARAYFADGSPSLRREYAEWISEAKTEETRDRRVATAVEWLSEGKSRNWKYKNC
jgi:uncharacterized protein YdeI (YjbR/CyaY-like superfamily)